ncbi:hypothetical protein XENOCAPTIV_019572 [Xenoophorus captivus]|uniref:Uncharacterized protein n=1 Tax=Xenoophorus captivus TaxID=1517983 RepID=A0ABV0S0C5_9TELE
MSSFLKSSGEFRGEPRGESLGDTLGDPAAEHVLDLGRSWTMGSRVATCFHGISLTSACSSSELSEHRSLMVDGKLSGRYTLCLLCIDNLWIIICPVPSVLEPFLGSFM